MLIGAYQHETLALPDDAVQVFHLRGIRGSLQVLQTALPGRLSFSQKLELLGLLLDHVVSFSLAIHEFISEEIVLCEIASALCRFRGVLFTSQKLRDMFFTPDDLQLALSAGLQKDSLLDDIFKVAFCVAVPHVIVVGGC